MHANRLSLVQLLVTPWTVARQAPLSMGFSRQDNEGGCHALLQGIFPTQGSNLRLLSLLHGQASSLPLAPPEKPTTGAEIVNSGYWRYSQKRLKPILGGFGCKEPVFNSLKETSLKVVK